MKKTGDLGERYAAEYLQRNGYRILERNWRGVKGMRSPEIDIIALKNNVHVFIEVKTTASDKYGLPQEWITPAKRKRLTQGAETYRAINNLMDHECRFDAVLIDSRFRPPEITHIINAFCITDIEPYT